MKKGTEQGQKRPTWEVFEDLVRRILEANGFSVEVHQPRGDQGFDFIANFGQERWAIEVKYYRTARAQPTLIETAANRLVRNGLVAEARRAMLVVSAVLSPEFRFEFENRYSVTFVDRVDLRMWASRTPSLAEELDALVEADARGALHSPWLRVDAPDMDPRGPTYLSWVRVDALASSRPLGPAPPTQPPQGTALCSELRQVKRGKKQWSEYERICERILRYLFQNDLEGWHKQKRTDDGLNRFDFVCRMRPTTEFWRFLIDHLNSRYVLFEFKNYSGKIKQGQILTTEKYLLERGLRRVAIILTRGGAEEPAVRMTQGAMREHGKLMLILTDDKICQMLTMKDRGEDPTDCLFDVAVDFLLTLPR